MEITLEEIQEKFKSLPEDLRWAIMAADIDSKIIDIANKYELTVTQMQQLSLETHAVVLGYTHPDKFEESLKQSLQLPDKKNREIVNEINEKILKEIRDKFKNIYKENKEIEKEEDYTLESREEMLKHIENPQPVTKIKIPVLSEQKELPAGNTEEIKIESSKNLSNLSPEKENLIPNKKDTYSILTQKLSGSFKIPTVETNHSIPNVTKDSERNKPELPRVDPYRMPIE